MVDLADFTDHRWDWFMRLSSSLKINPAKSSGKFRCNFPMLLGTD